MKLKTVFQDEDFKLGEVVEVDIATIPDGRIKAQAVAKTGGVHTFFYDNLKTFASDWEDYEEPKGSALHLMILTLTDFIENEPDEDKVDLENCKQMLEKLKAFKRLKDKGIEISHYDFEDNKYETIVEVTLDIPPSAWDDKTKRDLDIICGGEE